MKYYKADGIASRNLPNAEDGLLGGRPITTYCERINNSDLK